MKLVLVCGPWSSGTSAVAGMLAHFGLDGLGPYFGTNDERTPNSFESRVFRQRVQALADERTVRLTASPDAALDAMRAFRAEIESGAFGPRDPARPIFLKYPLSALLIPEICRAFDTRLVYVLRPLAGIEATRARREWAPHLGAQGARILYSRMFDALVEHAFPTTIIRYPELLARPLGVARLLANVAGVQPDPALLERAARFVSRPPAAPASDAPAAAAPSGATGA